MILIGGGIFLLWKSTQEIHQMVMGEEEHLATSTGQVTASSIIFQIIMIDLVFSLDSIITAVGLVDHVEVMIAAVVASVGLMMLFARIIGEFVSANPTIKMLALSFLLMVGLTLIVDGFGYHVPKGYIYFSMAFSLTVETLNLRMRKNRSKKVPAQHD